MIRRDTLGDEMTGMRIKSARRQAGMRLVDVAEIACISPSLLSKIECSLRRPSRQVLERLADFFSVSVQSLAGPERPNPSAGGGSFSLTWPSIDPKAGDERHNRDIIGLADMALSAAMHEAIPALTDATSTERFSACKVLAALASRPLETLSRMSASDPDPMVREASGQLLTTLSDSYCRAIA